MLGVSHLQVADFPTCLKSVLAPKGVDRFLSGWWHLIAFLKLYMVHVKRSKIGQENDELWG